ncbi:MAG: hypothetical protein LUQ25_02730 [Methanoregulaceae archaeon]|nr:hypothetical protein [Methanoregulaceae archaeon]
MKTRIRAQSVHGRGQGKTGIRLIMVLLVFLLVILAVSADDPVPDGPGRNSIGSESTVLHISGPSESPGDDIPDDLAMIEDAARRMEMQLDENLMEYSGDRLEQMRQDNRIRVAASTIHLVATVTAPGTTTWIELDKISEGISRIADDSFVQQDRIRNRNPVVRFFAGGDAQAAGALEQDAAGYRALTGRIEEIGTVSNFNQEVKPALDKPVATLRLEQERLTTIARKEREDRGILGWILQGIP